VLLSNKRSNELSEIFHLFYLIQQRVSSNRPLMIPISPVSKERNLDYQLNVCFTEPSDSHMLSGWKLS
jgi:5,10-methylenetetrahydrofolate reductase